MNEDTQPNEIDGPKQMVDRMGRMNKYVLEATKEDVKYPTK
jgi:hypothetical protein